MQLQPARQDFGTTLPPVLASSFGSLYYNDKKLNPFHLSVIHQIPSGKFTS
jgi:hypothetical protein